MISQIVNCANTELLDAIPPHDQRVGVVKAEWFSYSNAKLCQRLANVRLSIFQNFFSDGAGVLGVNIDLVPAKRLPENDGAAHTWAMLSWNAGIGQRAFCNFAEHIRFGKFFRADDDRLCLYRESGQEEKDNR